MLCVSLYLLIWSREPRNIISVSFMINTPKSGYFCNPLLSREKNILQVDHLLVKQKKELLETFLGFEGKNKYKIYNAAGQELYKAKEDTDCCTRNFLGANRPFDLEICDLAENELIHLYRPLRCTSCFFPCFLQVLEVYSPPGNLIGTVEQEWWVFVMALNFINVRGPSQCRG